MAKKKQATNNTAPERVFRFFCIKHGIQFVFQYKLTFGKQNKIYDFYLPDYNLIVEIDGVYWHQKNKDKVGNRTQISNHKNDLVKEFIAKHYKHNLVRIWEDEVENTDVVIKKLEPFGVVIDRIDFKDVKKVIL